MREPAPVAVADDPGALRLGHAIPNSDDMVPVARWIDESLADRRKFGKTFPASRADKVLTRGEHATALYREATDRMKTPDQFYAGLMQMKGILDRWPDLPEAAKAREILLKQEEKPEHNWEAQDIAEQRKFVTARARGLSAYALGDLPSNIAPKEPKWPRLPSSSGKPCKKTPRTPTSPRKRPMSSRSWKRSSSEVRGWRREVREPEDAACVPTPIATPGRCDMTLIGGCHGHCSDGHEYGCTREPVHHAHAEP